MPGPEHFREPFATAHIPPETPEPVRTAVEALTARLNEAFYPVPVFAGPTRMELDDLGRRMAQHMHPDLPWDDESAVQVTATLDEDNVLHVDIRYRPPEYIVLTIVKNIEQEDTPTC